MDMQVHGITDLILSANRALWGEVSAQLRAVQVSQEGSVIKLTCFFDGAICDDDAESVSEIGGEIAADFPDCTIEEVAVRIDAPGALPLSSDARIVFARKERPSAT